MSSPKAFYIAGNDYTDGRLRWSDGSLIPNPGEPDQRWATGQPDNPGIGNCIIVKEYNSGFHWRDFLCVDPFVGLCEDD